MHDRTAFRIQLWQNVHCTACKSEQRDNASGRASSQQLRSDHYLASDYLTEKLRRHKFKEQTDERIANTTNLATDSPRIELAASTAPHD